MNRALKVFPSPCYRINRSCTFTALSQSQCKKTEYLLHAGTKSEELVLILNVHEDASTLRLTSVHCHRLSVGQSEGSVYLCLQVGLTGSDWWRKMENYSIS